MAARPLRTGRRVAIVSLWSVIFGAERSMLLLCSHLAERGRWQPVILCPEGDLAVRARLLSLDVSIIPWREVQAISSRQGGRKSYPVRRLATAVSMSALNAGLLARACRQVGADAVISNSFAAHPFVVVGALLARRPAVLHARDIVEPGPGRRVLQTFARGAASVVAISDAVGKTITHPHLRVIENPVEPPAPAERPEWAGVGPVVGYLGRLDPHKGVEDLIAAAGRLHGARVAIVGEPGTAAPPGYLDMLRRLADDVAPDRIVFPGSVAEPGMAFSGFDVLAVPSRCEPWGRVAAEGLLAGVPVVAANAGGLPEIVRNGVDGLLYPPGDVAGLAAQIGRLLEDAPLRAEMGRAGRGRAERFRPARHAELVEELLDEVAER